MQPELSEWTIVLLGQWNPYIFQPAWLAQNVFLPGQQGIEINFVMGQGANQLRISTPQVNVIPGADRIIIGVQDNQDATLTEAERVAISILTTLRHTPLRAAGVNFGFQEPAPPAELSRHFNLSDNPQLTDIQYRLSRSCLLSFQLPPKCWQCRHSGRSFEWTNYRLSESRR
jgi:hypothetical protein